MLDDIQIMGNTELVTLVRHVCRMSDDRSTKRVCENGILGKKKKHRRIWRVNVKEKATKKKHFIGRYKTVNSEQKKMERIDLDTINRTELHHPQHLKVEEV